jgi:RNA recognition motif-containing protein
VGKRLFVGNLPFSMKEDELEALFAPHGELTSVTVIRDRATERSQGFGFVEFASEEQASVAMRSVNGKEVNGRALRVDEARERRTDGGAPRRSNGGGFGGDRSGFDRGGRGDREDRGFGGGRDRY